MPENELLANMDVPKPTRKKRYFCFWVLALVICIIILPIWSLKTFEQAMLSFKGPNPGRAAADCGVVLTGGAGRIREAISLFSQKKMRKMIISGVHQTSTLNDMFPEILFYPEIDLEDIVLERRSSTTESNAQQSLAVAEALNCKSVLLITSDYHLYRAYKTFAQVFPATLPVIPYAVSTDRLSHKRKLWFDSRYWAIVFEEWYKYLFYSVFVF
jgi:uncharacterized SAM-binding protein YcdF (DUF218 family)